MTFRAAQLRLLANIRNRIHNGELTERGFARMLGVSQPHVHNVLKGVRSLSVEISDSMLKTFNLSVLDLLTPEELEAKVRRKPPQRAGDIRLDLPYLDAPIGPGYPWPAGFDPRRRYPNPFLGPAPSSDWVVARLGHDPVMHTTLAGFDLAILDVSERQRAQASPAGLYAVEIHGEALLRYIRPGARGHYLVTDAGLRRGEWEFVGVSRADLPGFIKARAIWLGREQDRDLPVDQRGRFLAEVISS